MDKVDKKGNPTPYGLLVRAKELIAQGFAIGCYAKDRKGDEVTPESAEACRWCLLGALMRAYKDLDPRIGILSDRMLNHTVYEFLIGGTKWEKGLNGEDFSTEGILKERGVVPKKYESYGYIHDISDGMRSSRAVQSWLGRAIVRMEERTKSQPDTVVS